MRKTGWGEREISGENGLGLTTTGGECRGRIVPGNQTWTSPGIEGDNRDNPQV